MYWKLKYLAPLLGIASLLGCAEKLTLETSPDVIPAIWDPVGGVLPTPTNLVYNDVTERLDLPLDGDLPPAELEFRQYLNSLDGYPLQSSLTIPMGGDVNEGTINASFLMIDTTDNRPVKLRATYEPATQKIIAKARPDNPDEATLQPGRTYAFGLAGYGIGAEGANGEVIVADSAFYLVRSERNLTKHPDAMPGESREQKREVAQTLEDLRQDLQPLYAAMQARGIPRMDIASASMFTTTRRPAIWFDSDAGRIPVPNQVLVDPDTGLVTLPEDETDDESARELKERFNTYDGFSTSGAITMSATAQVNPRTITAESVRLFRFEDNGEIIEDNDIDRGLLKDGHTFYMKPRLALEPAHWYAYVVTRDLEADGQPVEPQPIGALLRSRTPLLVDGEPQVGILDIESAELLEPLRLKLAPLLDRLESQGLPRENISVAVPFRTTSALKGMLDLRASLYERDTPVGVRNIVNKTPIQRGLPLIMNDVETIITGELTTLDYLDPATRAFRPDGTPEDRSISFVLTIPEGATPGEPIPTVLFGHGLFTSRELVYLIADKLAESGYAVFTLDLPYHGERSVCFKDLDCRDSTCNDLGQCVDANGAIAEFEQISSPIPNGPQYPATSGSAFVEVDNIVGSRDHFAQAIVDLCQGLRVIRGADWSAATGGYTLDGGDVVYLGMSLGGILGSMMAAVEPTINDFALNVPGGNFFELLTTSDSFETAFQHVLDERGIQAGDDAYFEFETALRWLLDPVDPLNIAHHATIAPFEYVDPMDGQTKMSPVKRVIIQMAKGDIVVPNTSTSSLSERMQVPITEYEPLVSNHAFLFDPTSLNGARARTQIIEFFAGRQ